MPSQRDILATLFSAGVIDEGSRLVASGGGDTHSNYKLESEGSKPSLFIKVNTGQNAHALKSEYFSLQCMESLFPNVYPRPVTILIEQDITILVMELLELTSLPGDQSAALANLLVRQHQVLGDTFGWPKNNYIGLSAQLNEPCETWPEFFWERRISPQLGWARDHGLPDSLGRQLDSLKTPIQDALAAVEIAPVLLHGDLWSGNVGYNSRTQQPCFFDPAPYYGDPEADLAMTRLFGVFPAEFYETYSESGLQRPGFAKREAIYNLYHALNHFNLFGHGYLTLVNEKAKLIMSDIASTKLF